MALGPAGPEDLRECIFSEKSLFPFILLLSVCFRIVVFACLLNHSIAVLLFLTITHNATIMRLGSLGSSALPSLHLAGRGWGGGTAAGSSPPWPL